MSAVGERCIAATSASTPIVPLTLKATFASKNPSDMCAPNMDVLSSGVTSSSEKQNNNVVQPAELKALPRTRRARSNSDVNQTALSAKMAENGVKLLRRIRSPASVDSLTIIKESEVSLKENLLRNAVLKRRRSLKAQEERGDAPSVTSLENGEPKGVVELDAVGALSENCNGGESNGTESAQMNGHIENDSLENEEDSSKMCDSTSGDEKVVENSTCEFDEKATSEEAPNEDGKGVVNGENPEEKNEQDVSESSSQEEKIEVEENGPSKVDEDVEMECESAEEKVDADKTETVEKSEDCDLDMEVTEETPKDSHNEEVPSFNEKSTKDESSSEKVTKDGESDELRPDEKVTAKVNGIIDEWSDEVSEVGETIKKNSSDSVADKETSEPLVDNCKTTLDTVAGCNSEANADANISDECVLKKSADSKKLILPEDQDSLVT
ncbi:hypothetical protein LSTR_LSTR015836 [Laodelphax striatellus]|uniref:Uncharacterized protein n=1 Tax=Laodelphax striatellus TaxID=195883 RepID=A0A482X483_LAOST|nr:hypothetical protein LSTR_LSTR015836 [Laodelphax striatellus]